MPAPEGRGPRRALVLALALVICCAPAGAQTQDSLRVGIGQAVRMAVEYNHELASARLEVGRADARVQEAWGTALPRLDLNGRYTRALKKPVFFLPDFSDLESGRIVPIEIGSNHAVDLNLTASQVLFNSAVFVGVGAAKIYSHAAREGYRAKVAETVALARGAHDKVLVAQEAVALMRQTLANAQQNLHTTQALSAQGLVSEYDQLRAEVAVENLRPELLNIENGLQLALNTLKAVIGVPYDRPLAVEGKLEFVPVDSSIIAGAQEKVLTENHALAGLRLQSEVNDAIISAQKSEYLPVLSAFGTYQYVAQSNQFNISTNDFISASTVGLSLSLNIFNGLQSNARVEQATLEYRKSQEQVAGLELRLQTSTEAVLLNLEKARLRIISQGRTVDQAERGYVIATARYESGLATLLEVNDALLALTRAKVNRIEAIDEYKTAATQLDQLLGRVPDNLGEIE